MYTYTLVSPEHILVLEIVVPSSELCKSRLPTLGDEDVWGLATLVCYFFLLILSSLGSTVYTLVPL